ncbi:MAG: FitA-like ribbon-helix-helix domain-containing protein [Terrimicrobiaceae bacterium]
MPQLIVRNLEETVVRRLKKRAGEHGVSMEEEHRRILREALGASRKKPMSFKEFLLSMPDVGDDSIFERDRSVAGRATEQNLFED